MTLDPYAVLGIAPGASMTEVKRAYRRMAKAFHPDSAGEAAVPKFLALHEAYEAIVAGRPMRPQTAATWRRASTAWAADPTRARATGSSRTPGGSAAGSGAAGPTRRRPGPRPWADGGAPRPGAEGGTRRRSTRKATLGSTSYDDAVHEPFEPEWEGASWYGRASGTYWTINPREYADPRKHGPEYQERARRAARDSTAGGPGAGSETWSEAADAPSPGWEADAPSPGWEAEAPSRGWAADGGDADAARQRAGADARRRGRFDASAAARAHAAANAASRARMEAAARDIPDDPLAPPAGARIEGWIRALFAAHDLRTRLLLAAVGWPPLGVLAASIISQVTGCASFSVACEPPDDLLPLAAGAALYALLAAVPMLARLSAAGTIAIVLTAIPVAAFVVRTDAPSGAVPDTPLALAILALAWLVGMVAVLVASRGRILRA
ncbi:MAG: J domain-containing protein [Chloroflexi bacterium]|nr:J domain-containing protein [Chloroflexota bacterium]